MNLTPTTIAEVQEAVRSTPALRPRGGGTKPALSAPPDGAATLDLSGLRGVIEYEPAEYVFTALAGTPAAEVGQLLAYHGQYLPFDPLLVERGASLGGVVAANTAGPGRYRYGGVRDFLMGVRFVDGKGQVIRGGGKVVKNAAGFDLPKLMVGSLGQMGVLVEVSFKVFPAPPAYASLRIPCPQLEAAVEALYKLSAAPFDIEALDITVTGAAAAEQEATWLWVRVGGLAETLPARLERLRQFLRPDGNGASVLSGAEEQAQWRRLRELSWQPPGTVLIKIPLTPARIPGLVTALRAALDASQHHILAQHFSAGGNVAWIAWPGELRRSAGSLDDLLGAHGLPGMVLLGPSGDPYLGVRGGASFARRVKQVFDPDRRFV